jgi:hypothetical protein
VGAGEPCGHVQECEKGTQVILLKHLQQLHISAVSHILSRGLEESIASSPVITFNVVDGFDTLVDPLSLGIDDDGDDR